MDQFDLVIIGAGPGGEAAAYLGRQRGASVAIVDAGWFGGSCPHIGCVPSKSLLNSSAQHAVGAAYPWSRASDRRDYMINRPAGAAEPDDSGHVAGLEAAGATVVRGRATIVAKGTIEVSRDDTVQRISATAVIVAVGSNSRMPALPGLAAANVWTNREATLTRELPKSLIVLGGGPTGCEMAQVFARFGVPTTIVQSGPRILATDHPRNAEAVAAGLEASGVLIRTNVRAKGVRPGAGADAADVLDLDDGSSVEGHAILLAVGRTYPVDDLGLEHYGIDAKGGRGYPRDGRLRLADGLYMIGDPAGPEMHTHQAHYQGELAVRMALGDEVTPDYRALPRATYTDPEAASVGFSLEEARDAGLDAFELVADFVRTAKGYSIEATTGHVTIVVDRASHELVGAAMACPDASAAIHECVLAIRARIPVDVLADTIHAFPSTSRIFNGLFGDAARQLA